MMVERHPNIKEEIGDLIPGCENSSLNDIKLAKWSIALMCFGVGMSALCLTKRKKENKENKNSNLILSHGLSNYVNYTIHAKYYGPH